MQSTYLFREEQAFRLAKKWIFANFKVYRETKQMWEKVRKEKGGKMPLLYY
jgi:hypothetical protein